MPRGSAGPAPSWSRDPTATRAAGPPSTPASLPRPRWTARRSSPRRGSAALTTSTRCRPRWPSAAARSAATARRASCARWPRSTTDPAARASTCTPWPATCVAAPATGRSATRPRRSACPTTPTRSSYDGGWPHPPRRTPPWVDGAFARPADLAEALALLREHPGATVVAGSTDWGVEVNLRGRRAARVVAIDRLPELRTISTDGPIEVGAGLTLSELEEALGDAVPLLTEVWPLFASPLIRNAATVGGNLGTASPIGDLAPALLALEASLVLASVDGRPRGRAGRLLHRLPRDPARDPASSSVPSASRSRSPSGRASTRSPSAASTTSPAWPIAFALDVDDGVVTRARIGLGGVAATPIRATGDRGRARGQALDRPRRSRRRPSVLSGEGTPIDDQRASAAYRSAMLGNALRSWWAERVERRRQCAAPRECGAPRHRAGALHRRPGPPDAPRPARPPGLLAARARADHPARHRRGARRRGGGACAHRRGRAGDQRCRHQARRAALPRDRDVRRAGRVLGAGGDPRGRPARCRGRHRRLRAASCGDLADRGDRGRELPGGPPGGRARGGRRRARPPRPTSSRASTEMAGQEHFYLETHAALALVDEGGQVFVQCSTQHPTETQEIVAHVLGVQSHHVTAQCLRMGGGFGGKEMQPHGFAAVAALGAVLTGRPVRVRLDRTHDLTMTGKRHGFHATWRVGFDDDGRLSALDGDADLRRRLEPRPERAGARPGAVPRRQRLLDPARAPSRPGGAHPQDLADGVPRLRRAAGDAGDRGHPRPVRPAAGDGPDRPAPPQLLRRGAGHAVRPAGAPPRAHRRRVGAGAGDRRGGRQARRRSRTSTPPTRTASAAWR